MAQPTLPHIAAAQVERLEQQLRFATALDRLKGVERRTPVLDGARRENSAEHSWHAAVLALVLAEYAPAGADASRAARMLLVHDLVEIDAGDTFAYDVRANEGKAEREMAAARALFGLLPAALGQELQALWEEFEAGESPDARFANALDRFQALLQNVSTGGGSWREHRITRTQVMRRMAPVEQGAPGLWQYVLLAIERGCAEGHITVA